MGNQTTVFRTALIKRKTCHSSETHWVKVLGYTSFDNWGTCWATQVREGLQTAMDDMTNFGSQGHSRLLSKHKGSDTTLLPPRRSPEAP